MFLKVEIGPVWADWPTPHLFKTARIVGPQIHELAIFLIIQTSIEFWFCERYSWNIFKSEHNGLIGRPLFFKTAHKMGHQIHELAFFYKMDPIWIWILCKKKLKIFQIGPLWYDWQTSSQYVQNCPQYSKYLWKIAGHKYRRGPEICQTNFTSTYFFCHSSSSRCIVWPANQPVILFLLLLHPYRLACDIALQSSLLSPPYG